MKRQGRDEPLDLAQALKTADADRYLAVVASPPSAPLLKPLLGLFLFNAELARTSEVARESLVADIRLKWWHDALADAAEAGDHPQPALSALAPALARGRLPLEVLQSLVEARQPEQDPVPFPDLDAFVAHARAGGGRLNGLAARLLEAGEEEQAAAEELGTAFALMGLLRGARPQAGRGRLLLPADLVGKAEVGVQSLASGRGGEALAAMAQAVAGCAEAALAEARRLQLRLPRGRAAPFLLAALTDLSLKRLKQGGWNPLAPGFVLPAAGRAWRLLLHRLRRQV